MKIIHWIFLIGLSLLPIADELASTGYTKAIWEWYKADYKARTARIKAEAEAELKAEAEHKAKAACILKAETEFAVFFLVTEAFCKNGKLHRKDGPAIEYTNGSEEWYANDELHRLDGPAVVFSNGHKAWYINGEKLTQEEHARRTQGK